MYKNAKGWDSNRLSQLADQIRRWLIDHDMWYDTAVYYDGKCMEAAADGKGFEITEDYPNFDYYPSEHILSLRFEGPLYALINRGEGALLEEFRALFQAYGLYFELGNAWNFSCFEISGWKEGV